MHVGNRFVVDIRHKDWSMFGYHAHIDLVEDGEDGQTRVLEANDTKIPEEADWTWIFPRAFSRP